MIMDLSRLTRFHFFKDTPGPLILRNNPWGTKYYVETANMTMRAGQFISIGEFTWIVDSNGQRQMADGTHMADEYYSLFLDDSSTE